MASASCRSGNRRRSLMARSATPFGPFCAPMCPFIPGEVLGGFSHVTIRSNVVPTAGTRPPTDGIPVAQERGSSSDHKKDGIGEQDLRGHGRLAQRRPIRSPLPAQGPAPESNGAVKPYSTEGGVTWHRNTHTPPRTAASFSLSRDVCGRRNGGRDCGGGKKRRTNDAGDAIKTMEHPLSRATPRRRR